MIRKGMKWIVLGIPFLSIVLGSFFQAAEASSFPRKPITVLQGFKPGGGSDALAQLTQPFLEKLLGTSFINQYIPGATGAIAWTRLARATRNDGYTLSITNTPMLMTNYIMNPEIKYAIEDFEPIANVVTDPGIVVVGKDSPFKTIQEFLAAAKAAPGKLTVGNSGVGGDDFFTVLMLQRATGLRFQQIPFEGDGPSWLAAMGMKIDASFNNLGITYPQIRAGNLRALVVFSEKRDPSVPNVPTMKEIGFDVVNGSSRGYSAPRGIPAEARTRLIRAFQDMAKDPAFQKAAADRAQSVDMMFGEEYGKFLLRQERDFRLIWDEVKSELGKK